MSARACLRCGTANPASSSNAKCNVDYCRTCKEVTPFGKAGAGAGAGANADATVTITSSAAASDQQGHAWWAFRALGQQIEGCRGKPGLWAKFLAPFRNAEITSTSRSSAITGSGFASGFYDKQPHPREQTLAAKAKHGLASGLESARRLFGGSGSSTSGYAAAVDSIVAGEASVVPGELLALLLRGSKGGAAALVDDATANVGTDGVASVRPACPHRLAFIRATATLQSLLDAHAADLVLQLQGAAHAHGLHVNGCSLQPPRFEVRNWRPSQVLTVAQDPDRTAELWQAPSFVTQVDPVAQRGLTTVEELTPKLKGLQWQGRGPSQYTSFARVVHNVLTPAQCADLLVSVNAKGFTPALLNIGGGSQMYAPRQRDGHRIIVDSSPVADWLFQVLEPHLPSTLEGQEAIELNERCRFLCYTPGQEFGGHCDGCYRRPRGHGRYGDTSQVTVQLYLHDVPVCNGGATTFDPDSTACVPCQPKAGSVLLFTQDLYHAGSRVHSGIKYTMRTEVMYGAKRPGSAPSRTAAIIAQAAASTPVVPSRVRCTQCRAKVAFCMCSKT